jgi:hypothetical protein
MNNNYYYFNLIIGEDITACKSRDARTHDDVRSQHPHACMFVTNGNGQLNCFSKQNEPVA